MRNTFLFLFVLFALDLALGLSLLRWGGPHLKVHVLDVGQGDAVLVTTPEHHAILVDGGPGQKVLEELGEVLPITQHELDLLILTHPHLDHMEGLVAVLQRFKVDNILLSAPTYDSLVYTAFLDALEKEQAHIWVADDDRDFRLGSLHIDVLYPFEPTLGKDFENVNNASPVLKLSQGPFSILLSGDAEEEVEEAVLSHPDLLAFLKADLMKAGHHGSRTSNTEAFLRAVDPQVLAISAGVGNSYGHPHPETLEKAQRLGIEVLRTDTQGRLSFVFEEKLPHMAWMRSILAPRLRSLASSSS